MSMVSLVQSHYHEGSSMGKKSKVKVGRIFWKGMEWRSDESGDDVKDGLTSEWDKVMVIWN